MGGLPGRQKMAGDRDQRQRRVLLELLLEFPGILVSDRKTLVRHQMSGKKHLLACTTIKGIGKVSYCFDSSYHIIDENIVNR